MISLSYRAGKIVYYSLYVTAALLILSITALLFYPSWRLEHDYPYEVFTSEEERIEDEIIETELPEFSGMLHEVEPMLVTEELGSAIRHLNDSYIEEYFDAEAAYIVDEYGNVICDINGTEALYPASVTKLLTALVVVENVEDLDAQITVAELRGCYEEGSTLMYIQEGDRITVRELMQGLLLRSYNDTATALAMEVGGSLEGFSQMMNDKARELGCTGSNFVTPHGLFDYDHYTTARDMNLILQAAFEHEEIRDILMLPAASATIHRGTGYYTSVDFENSSYFIKGQYDLPGFTFLGGKTGYIMKARSCYASVFEKGGTKYYCTVLKSLDASYMTMMLLDYYLAPDHLSELVKIDPIMRAPAADSE